MLSVVLTCIDLPETGSRLDRGTAVEDVDKLKVRLAAYQTIGHLKVLIANATTAVTPPFKLQEHGAEKPAVFDDDNTLSDCGLVSGSVVCIPAELLDIRFVLPPGMHRVRKGSVVEDGNMLKVQVEAHQAIGSLKALIAHATTAATPPFKLQKHGAEKMVVFDDGKTLRDCGLVSGSVVCAPAEPFDIHFVLPPGMCR